jgi:N-acetylglucosamine kinase-like BadF-type ATPase
VSNVPPEPCRQITAKTFVTNPRTHAKPCDPGEVLVAVDGGGTRTRCAVFDHRGKIVKEMLTNSANHLVANSKQALESMAGCISDALRDSTTRKEQLRAVSVGLAGVDLRGEGAAEAAEFLRDAGFETCFIHADTVAAHAGAFGGGPGVLALSGTGAAILGVSEDGHCVMGGGWGPAYGDEGSAHWVGQQALRAAAAAYDGRGPATLLVGLICETLGLKDFSETLRCIYRSQTQVSLIAELSLTTECAAAAGDRVALGILTMAGEELARGVEAVVRGLGVSSSECRVSWEGGVLRNSEIVRAQFCSAIHRLLPTACVAQPLFDPLYGAYLMGCISLGWESAKQ